MAVQIKSADPTERFVGTEEDPRQVLRVVVERAAADGVVTLSLTGDGVRGVSEVAAGDGEEAVELAFAADPALAAPGAERDAVLTATTASGARTESPVRLRIAEP